MRGAPAVIQIERLDTQYHGLRPLRISRLAVQAGERVALTGLDLPAAETLVSLIAGATLPDAGEVWVGDVSTTAIDSSGDWFAALDRIGIMTHRAVLLDGMTVAQNVALPLTIRLDPLPEPEAARAQALARAVNLPADSLDARVDSLAPAERARVHLARAVALDPELLLLEHPTLGLDPGDVPALARDIVALAAARRMAVLALTNDMEFAHTASHRVVRLRPVTGAVERVRRFRWTSWVRRLAWRGWPSS